MDQKLKAWPVAMGVLADLIGTSIFGLAYGIFAAASAGPDVDELVMTTTDWSVVTGVGLLLVVAGGYVAGRQAGIRPLAHGVCVGVVLVIVSAVLEVVAPEPDTSQWLMSGFSLLATVPCGAFGGWLSSSGPRE